MERFQIARPTPMEKHADFEDVLSILDKNGDEILGQISLQSYTTLNKANVPQVSYSCYDGIYFLASLFGLNARFGFREKLEHLDECKARYESGLEYEKLPEAERGRIHAEMVEIARLPTIARVREIRDIIDLLEQRGVPNIRMTPGSMYFCQLNTNNSRGAYETDQVHYFVFIYDSNPTLIQAFGDVKGILVKRVRHEINALIGMIFKFDHEVYRRLFEVPDSMEYLLHFDQASFRAIQMPLFYSDLKRLDYLLQLISLDFAREKLRLRI